MSSDRILNDDEKYTSWYVRLSEFQVKLNKW